MQNFRDTVTISGNMLYVLLQDPSDMSSVYLYMYKLGQPQLNSLFYLVEFGNMNFPNYSSVSFAIAEFVPKKNSKIQGD